MRKSILLVSAIMLAGHVNAQMNNYFFQRESGLLTDVENYTGAQITNHIVQDDIVSNAKVPMPFAFKFGNQQIDTIGIAENGYLFVGTLSAFAVSSPWPISTQHPSQVKGIISPLGIDLHPVNTPTQKTTIKSALVGTFPFRMFIIEWKHTSTIDTFDNGTPDDISFQIKLYETTGRIEFAYGNFTLSTNSSANAEVGLKGATFNDYNNRIATATNWSTSIPGSSQMDRIALNTNSKPEYGTLYVWERMPSNIGDVSSEHAAVYPIPATRELYIIYNSHELSKTSFVISDVSGRAISKGTVSNTAIDISDLVAGLYILQLETTGKKQLVKFYKQ